MRQTSKATRPGRTADWAAGRAQRWTVTGEGPGRAALLAVLMFAPMLTACDKIGLPGMGGPSAADVRREAEGRAIGGACRHAGRAIEDCFALNRQADKAAVFAGWREMNDYMAEKNIAALPAAGGETAAASGQRNGSDTGGR